MKCMLNLKEKVGLSPGRKMREKSMVIVWTYNSELVNDGENAGEAKVIIRLDQKTKENPFNHNDVKGSFNHEITFS